MRVAIVEDIPWVRPEGPNGPKVSVCAKQLEERPIFEGPDAWEQAEAFIAEHEIRFPWIVPIVSNVNE